MRLNADPDTQPHGGTYAAALEAFLAGSLAAPLGLVKKCAATIKFDKAYPALNWCPASFVDYGEEKYYE